MNRRVALLALGLAVIGALAWAFLRSQTPPSVLGPLPGTYGPIRMVAYLEGHASPRTAQDVRRIATSSTIVIAQPGRMRRLAPALAAAGPGLRLIVYENGMFSTPTDHYAFPDSWYLHQADGRRIHSATHPANTLMNPLSTEGFDINGTVVRGWAAYVGWECVRDQAGNTAGCYLDALGVAGFDPTHTGAAPIDPRTGRPFTRAGFGAAALRIVTAVRGALPRGFLVLANGFGSGPIYYAGGRFLAGRVDGAQAQSWLGRDATTLTLAAWKQSVQMVIASGRAGTAAMLRYRCRCAGADVSAQRMYALATYLLANTGRAYFGFDDNKAQPWQQWSSVYGLDLGRPIETRSTVDGYLHAGVYRRAYQRGLVMVNPSARSVIVGVSPGYETLSHRPVRVLTIRPHQGLILIR